MTKLILNEITNVGQVSVLNDNFDKIEDFIQDRVLSRSNPTSDANEMQVDLDMNGKKIYNLPEPTTPSEAARLQDVTEALAGASQANLISVTPAGNISSTNVQAALQELDTEKVSQASLDAHINDTTAAHAASAISFTQSGTGAAVRDVDAKLKEIKSVKDFGAVGNGIADDTAAISAAITAAAVSYGKVYIPAGHYKISAALPAPYGVSVYGEGGLASVIEAYNCDGFSSTNGVAWDQNMSVYEDFGIRAMSGTNHVGFRVATNPYAGEQDGFHLNRLRFFEWDTAIYGGSLWQSHITECWIEQVNTGIRLDGHAVLVNIVRNNIIRTGGGRGSAASIGVIVGNTDIEANIVADNFIFGFKTCIQLGDPWHCTVERNTLLAAGSAGDDLVGIDFTTVKEHLNIVGNMVECISTATGTWKGIYGRATFTPSNAQTIIQNNRIWDDVSLSTNSVGIQINDISNTNQNNVVIENNNLFGHTLYDIAAYNPQNVVIQNNDCRSAGVPTYNILIYGGVVGPAIAKNNRCIKAIYAEAASYVVGDIVLENNTEANVFRGLKGSAIYDPASLADGAGVTTTVTVTGAALGDYAKASFSLDLQGVTLTAWVSAANTVSVRFQNESGGIVDLASGTLRAKVERA